MQKYSEIKKNYLCKIVQSYLHTIFLNLILLFFLECLQNKNLLFLPQNECTV